MTDEEKKLKAQAYFDEYKALCEKHSMELISVLNISSKLLVFLTKHFFSKKINLVFQIKILEKERPVALEVK